MARETETGRPTVWVASMTSGSVAEERSSEARRPPRRRGMPDWAAGERSAISRGTASWAVVTLSIGLPGARFRNAGRGVRWVLYRRGTATGVTIRDRLCFDRTRSNMAKAPRREPIPVTEWFQDAAIVVPACVGCANAYEAWSLRSAAVTNARPRRTGDALVANGRT